MTGVWKTWKSLIFFETKIKKFCAKIEMWILSQDGYFRWSPVSKIVKLGRPIKKVREFWKYWLENLEKSGNFHVPKSCQPWNILLMLSLSIFFITEFWNFWQIIISCTDLKPKISVKVIMPLIFILGYFANEGVGGGPSPQNYITYILWHFRENPESSEYFFYNNVH